MFTTWNNNLIYLKNLALKQKFLVQDIKTVHNYCFYYNTFCRCLFYYNTFHVHEVEQLTYYDWTKLSGQEIYA